MKIKDFLKIQLKKPHLTKEEHSNEIKKKTIETQLYFCQSRLNAVILLNENDKYPEALLIIKQLLVDIANLILITYDINRIDKRNQIEEALKQLPEQDLKDLTLPNKKIVLQLEEEEIDHKTLNEVLIFIHNFFQQAEKKAQKIIKEKLRTPLNDYWLRLYVHLPFLITIVTAAILICLYLPGYLEYQRHISKIEDFPLSIRAKKGEFIKEWLVLGKIPYEYSKAFDHDFLKEYGGEAKYLPSKEFEYKLDAGNILKWFSYMSDTDRIDFLKLFKDTSNATAYAFTVLELPTDYKGILSIGSDDGIKVWINGNLALQADEVRPCMKDDDKAEVTLRKGKNAILVKITQKGGGWCFFLRFL